MFAKLTRPSWQHLLMLFLLVLLAGIGLRYPWPADEPRYALVAMEMVHSGQWLFPTRAGELYPDKPPLFMWLIAGAYHVTGNIKVAFLLPSLLSGLITLLLTYDLARRLYRPKMAMLAVLMLIAAPQFVLQAKTAQIDALVGMWITLGVYGLIRHFLLGPAWGWFSVAWVATALGIISKGVGFLPLLLLIPLAIWRKTVITPGSWRHFAWSGPFIMLAVIAIWLVPMWYLVQSSGNPDFAAYRDNILFQQTAERYVSARHHLNPWHYFFTQVIPIMWFPLPLLLLLGWRQLAALWQQDIAFRVLLSWVVLVVLFFSFSSGKRGVYIYPALPAFAIICAVLWSEMPLKGRRWSDIAISVLSAVVLLITSLVGVAAWLQILPLPSKLIIYHPLITQLAPWLISMGVISAGMMYLLRGRPAFWRLAIIVLLNWLLVSLVFWPKLDPYRTPQAIMAKVEQLLPPGAELAMVQFKEQFLLFAKRPLTQFSYLLPTEQQLKSAWRWQQQKEQRYILLSSHATAAPDCFNLEQSIELGVAHRATWLLLPAASARSHCAAPTTFKLYQFQPRVYKP